MTFPRLVWLLLAIAATAALLNAGSPASSSRETHKKPRLDPDLRAALRHATADAAREGVTLTVESGLRSRAHQQRLFDAAVAEYGSAAEAARWVAPPDRSAHVTGDAVDVGPPEAAAWLGARGAAYGLCQMYANEPWHFELRPAATAAGCPPLYADASQDPRMR